MGRRQLPDCAAAALRALVLLVFTAFFAGPIVWLLLAPTKTGYELATRSPFAFGSFHTVAATWHELDSFNDHVYRRWLENSLLYSFGATSPPSPQLSRQATAWRSDGSAAGRSSSPPR